jgi:hypothetical protein
MSLVDAVSINLPTLQKVSEYCPLEIGQIQLLFSSLMDECRLFDNEKSAELYLELPIKKDANPDEIYFLFEAFTVDIADDKLFISVDPLQLDETYETYCDEEDYEDD